MRFNTLIVLGTLQGDYFVVCVLDPHEFSEGKIVPGSAFAEFRVSVCGACKDEELMKGRYTIALLSGSLSKAKSYVYCVPAKNHRPYRSLQVDAQVSAIQPNGFFVQIGPMSAFVGRAVCVISMRCLFSCS
jgi:hypothetical protein